MIIKHILKTIFVLVLSVGAFSLQGFAAEFNVTDETGFQAALNTAESNDEDDIINIAAGTYNTNGSTFNYGPAATEGFSLTLVGEDMATTILDGGDNENVLLMGLNSIVDTSNVVITVENLTIQNGSSVGMTIGDGQTSVIEIQNCMFSSNIGTGASVESADVSITNNVFVDNEVTSSGAGLDIFNAENAVVTNNDFTNNTTTSGDGGGAKIEAVNVTLNDNIFTGNSSETGRGGAVFINGEVGGDFDIVENVTINNNEFRGNAADGGPGGGLLVQSEGVVAELNNNIFINNSTSSSGGGGGISCCGPFPGPAQNVNMANNVFINNSADFASGGFNLFADTGNIINNTFTLNSAGTSAGGLSVSLFGTGGPINIFNNIIFDNTAVTGGDDIRLNEAILGALMGGTVNVFNNDFSDLLSFCDNSGFCTPNNNLGDNIDADPLFVNLAAEDVSLQEGSPAIDTGDDATCAVVDRIGTLRPQDGNEDGILICDMGAVELLIAAAEDGGGCSLAPSGRKGVVDLSIFMLFPALILIRRILKR